MRIACHYPQVGYDANNVRHKLTWKFKLKESHLRILSHAVWYIMTTCSSGSYINTAVYLTQWHFKQGQCEVITWIPGAYLGKKKTFVNYVTNWAAAHINVTHTTAPVSVDLRWQTRVVWLCKIGVKNCTKFNQKCAVLEKNKFTIYELMMYKLTFFQWDIIQLSD